MYYINLNLSIIWCHLFDDIHFFGISADFLSAFKEVSGALCHADLVDLSAI